MSGGWEPDPKMIEEVVGPSGTQYTIRRDVFALMLAEEADAALQGLPDGHPIANYLRDEISISADALRFGTTSALAEEPFAALVFARFGVETAIRISWVMGAGAEDEKVRTRLRRLEKLELRQLLSASDAISQVSDLGPLVANASELEQIVESISEPEAPRFLRTMAAEADWEWLYAIHRFCSSALHPGVAARGRIAESLQAKELTQILYYSFSGTVMAVGGLAAAVFPAFDVTKLRLNGRTFSHGGDPEQVFTRIGGGAEERG